MKLARRAGDLWRAALPEQAYPFAEHAAHHLAKNRAPAAGKVVYAYGFRRKSEEDAYEPLALISVPCKL